MSAHYYIACDLGAESGRVILGRIEDGFLRIEEIHRFANVPVSSGGSLHWDVVRIFEELKIGLRKVAERGIQAAGVSCDSWGVDYVLLNVKQTVVMAPFHYRDARTDGVPEKAFAVVPREQIFAETGIQFMPINTLYQFLADLRDRPLVLEAAERFLNMADYFNLLFSGVAKAEESLASTTQLFNPFKKRWSGDLIKRFDLPGRIFPEIVPSGTELGTLVPALESETGLQGVKVVAGCSHDTAAAVAAVPARGDSWAYISSGTWSLLGVEIPEPIVTAKSREYNFTNEVGFGGTIRLLKNIHGMWLLQECRRSWMAAGKEYGYEELTEMAETVPSWDAFIDVRQPQFSKPGDMPGKIAAACLAEGGRAPSTPAETIRCVLESLAFHYRQTLHQLEDLIGRQVKTLHVVGGGSKNRLLNQLTANATGKTVLAGPAESSAIGNVLAQAIALGHVTSLQAGREMVQKSFPLVRFEPDSEASKRYAAITG